MEIIGISHNDSLSVIAQKCDANFRQLFLSMRNSITRQGGASKQDIAIAINAAVQNLTSVIIPQEVDRQIDALDIPGTIDDEVSDAIIPPLGTYVMSDTSPATTYHGTTWTQVDTVDTTGGLSIPLWKRTS